MRQACGVERIAYRVSLSLRLNVMNRPPATSVRQRRTSVMR